jgi:hypothetical protein
MVAKAHKKIIGASGINCLMRASKVAHVLINVITPPTLTKNSFNHTKAIMIPRMLVKTYIISLEKSITLRVFYEERDTYKKYSQYLLLL